MMVVGSKVRGVDTVRLKLLPGRTQNILEDGGMIRGVVTGFTMIG